MAGIQFSLSICLKKIRGKLVYSLPLLLTNFMLSYCVTQIASPKNPFMALNWLECICTPFPHLSWGDRCKRYWNPARHTFKQDYYTLHSSNNGEIQPNMFEPSTDSQEGGATCEISPTSWSIKKISLFFYHNVCSSMLKKHLSVMSLRSKTRFFPESIFNK